MRTTPTPKRGLVSDDPTGRNLWQDRPDGNPWQGIVRTSFSVPSGLRFNSLSRGSRSPATASWSRSSSISWESRTRSTAPTALCGSGGERQSPPQYRAEATPCGSTRPAEPHPTGRQRVCGKAQSRLIDYCSQSNAAVETADCCGALGCRVEVGLRLVTVDGKTRVLCEDCVREFVQEASR